jgi:hypothetical protein
MLSFSGKNWRRVQGLKTALSMAVAVLAGACAASPALADGIFDSTPLSGAANWVGERTPSGKADLQKLEILSSGDTTTFENAMHDSAPLAAAIDTLGCAAACAGLANAVVHPSPLVDVIYTTGAILNQESTEDYLYNLTIVGADKQSGEVGSETISVTLHTTPPTHNMVTLKAACILQSNRNGSGFVTAYWTTAPSASAADLHPGDTVSVTAPACHSAFGTAGKSITKAHFMYEGGKTLSLAKPHYQFVAAGPQ